MTQIKVYEKFCSNFLPKLIIPEIIVDKVIAKGIVKRKSKDGGDLEIKPTHVLYYMNPLGFFLLLHLLLQFTCFLIVI